MDDPAWLTAFGAGAPAAEVVQAWLGALDSKARDDAQADPASARTALRLAIVDARDTCGAVKADASAGWKYTGEIIRAVDAALGVAPVKPVALFGPRGAALHAPVRVADGDGEAGSLGLFWSDVHGASRADLLRANGITHRLNVADECARALPEAEGLVTRTVPMVDLQHEQMEDPEAVTLLWLEQLRESVEQLRAWRAAGAVVNVNCQAGKNRSGAVVAAWLCLECGWELLPCVEHCRQLSNLALGNPHLNVALAELVGGGDVDIPLNPADDGGSWVTFSPPGTPKLHTPEEGDVAGDVAGEAARRLAALACGPTEEAADEAEEGLDGLLDVFDEF